MRLAEQQAKREEELNGARRQVTDLEAEVADLVREMELRQEQEAALKEVRPVTSTMSPPPLVSQVLRRQMMQSWLESDSHAATSEKLSLVWLANCRVANDIKPGSAPGPAGGGAGEGACQPGRQAEDGYRVPQEHHPEAVRDG